MVLSLADYPEYDVVETTFSLAANATTPVAAGDVSRVAIWFCFANQTFSVSTKASAGANQGFQVAATYPLITLNTADHGPIVCYPWFARAAALASMTVFEIFLRRETERGVPSVSIPQTSALPPSPTLLRRLREAIRGVKA